MKTLLLAALCSALVGTAIPGVAGAKDAPSKSAAAPELPSVTYDGKHAAELRYGDLVVTLDSEPTSKDLRVPTFKGTYQGRPVFSVRVEGAEDAEPQTTARMVRLDPRTALPQVVMVADTVGL